LLKRSPEASNLGGEGFGCAEASGTWTPSSARWAHPTRIASKHGQRPRRERVTVGVLNEMRSMVQKRVVERIVNADKAAR